MKFNFFRLLSKLKLPMEVSQTSSEIIPYAKLMGREQPGELVRHSSLTFSKCVACTDKQSWKIQTINNETQKIYTSIPLQKLSLSETNNGKLHIALTDRWTKQRQPMFQLKLAGKKVVIVNKAEEIVQILHGVTNDTSGRFSPFFQRHVFNDCGFSFKDLTETSERQKAILRNSLNSWKRRSIIDAEISTFIRALSRDEHVENIDQRIQALLSDLFTTLLIGETLPEDDPDRNALWDLVNQLYMMLEPSVDLPLRMFPFLRHLPGKHGRVFRKAIEARDKVSKQFFDSQKETYVDGRIRGLVDVCLQIQQDEVREKGETWLSDDYIKGIMYDTVAAGMTEMMKSLRMLVLLMCHHQNVQSRVQTEIDDVMGGEFPAASHQKEMPYTQAVIFEMLRYVSQTPLAIPHKSNKDIMLNGYLIEKNSGIFPNIWGIHHDEEVWGDPWVFRPERFLDDNQQLISKHHKTMKSFIPFSVGKRRCPGENFAMSRIFIIFTALLQKTTFTAPVGQDLPSVDPRLYTNKYPMVLPIYTCRALPRESTSTATSNESTSTTTSNESTSNE